MIVDVSSNLNDSTYKYLAKEALKQALQFGTE